MTPEELFNKCQSLMGAKAHDYTKDAAVDRYENFSRSSLVASWFSDDKDKVFVVLIATKLARLATLLGNKEPKNESIEDSFVDLINYCALWAGERTSREKDNLNEQEQSKQKEPICFFCSSPIGTSKWYSTHRAKVAHESCYNGASPDRAAAFLSA